MVIYITTNLINGKQYIGRDSHNNPNYYGSGTFLKKAIRKYGRENFKKEILEVCQSEDHLSIREEYWLNYYDAGNNPMFYNIHNHSHGSGSGEKSSWYGKRHCEITKKKLSERKNGKNHPNYGKHLSEETRRKISQGVAGENNAHFKGYAVCINGKHIGEKHITSTWSSILGIDKGNIYHHLNGKTYKKGIKGHILKWEHDL
jgi:group I intron endonuclease